MPVKTLQKRTQDRRTNMQSERERKAEVGSEKKKWWGFGSGARNIVNEKRPKKGREIIWKEAI